MQPPGVADPVMDRLADVSLAELRDWLDEVRQKETTERLIAAIGYKQGIDIRELSAWYGWPERTIEQWFDEFDSKPLPQVVDETERYHHQQVTPFIPEVEATVEYLDYEVLDDYGWSIDDDDLFEKAHDTDLDAGDFGRIEVEPGESILEAAEKRGFQWPYACRGGACSNCVVILKEGDIAMPGNTILTAEMIETYDARLTCVGVPMSEEIKLVYNAKHLPELDELRLPPRQF